MFVMIVTRYGGTTQRNPTGTAGPPKAEHAGISGDSITTALLGRRWAKLSDGREPTKAQRDIEDDPAFGADQEMAEQAASRRRRVEPQGNAAYRRGVVATDPPIAEIAIRRDRECCIWKRVIEGAKEQRARTHGGRRGVGSDELGEDRALVRRSDGVERVDLDWCSDRSLRVCQVVEGVAGKGSRDQAAH